MSLNRLTNLTIIVVEDHDDARKYLGLFLDSLGATVVLARNGFEGLQATRDSRPNLVVSDIQMAGMNGVELLRAIRAFGPEAGGNVPFIAMTAVATNADRVRLLNTGFQECLPKPFTPEHYEMAGYGTARSLARRMGDHQTAELLQQTLNEEGEANKKLNTIAESRVNVAASSRA